jgi:HAD superfamily hydrolase (TIGR01509 family)
MPLDASRIRALCFDIDGTLRDTDDQYVARLERYLKPLRIFFPTHRISRMARWLVMQLEGPGNFLISLPDRMGFDEFVWKLMQRFASQRDNKQGRHAIIAGAQTTLEMLADRFPMAVVTARSHRATVDFLHYSGLSDHLTCIASALTTKRGKPHPAPILWAAQQMNVPPEACLMIGDTKMDILAGKAAGAQTVGVLSGFGTEKELRNCGADEILGSIRELLPLILQN